MSEYGRDNKVVESDSQRTREVLPGNQDGRPFFVNGHVIRVFDYALSTKITIDGKVFNGDYFGAIRHCATLPKIERSE